MTAQFDFVVQDVSPSAASLPQPPPPDKSDGDAQAANSDKFSSATDEAVARCKSGVGGERSRSEGPRGAVPCFGEYPGRPPRERP